MSGECAKLMAKGGEGITNSYADPQIWHFLQCSQNDLNSSENERGNYGISDLIQSSLCYNLVGFQIPYNMYFVLISLYLSSHIKSPTLTSSSLNSSSVVTSWPFESSSFEVS